MPRFAAPRRFALVLLMVAMVSVCLPGVAQKHHKREAREQIEALEQQWRHAELSDDVAVMDKLLSEDYLGIAGNGEVMTKAQQLDRMRAHDLVITKLDVSDLKVKLVGRIAVVTSRAKLDGSLDGKSMRGNYRYTRIYQRLPNGTWKITNFEATRIAEPGEESASRG